MANGKPVTEAESRAIIDNSITCPIRYGGKNMIYYHSDYLLMQDESSAYSLVHKSEISKDAYRELFDLPIPSKALERAVVAIYQFLDQTESGRFSMEQMPEIKRIITSHLF